MNAPIRIKTITEAHRIIGLPKPEHPLISLFHYSDVPQQETAAANAGALFDFYFISLKKGFCNKLHYGQQTYDFDDGMMMFVSPNQVIRGEGATPEDDLSGWILLVHPDLLWNTPLAKKIIQYEFFDYAVNEALFLSEREENVINEIIKNIQHEYKANIDKFSKQIIVSHLDNLLSYAERFYNRQFISREKSNHQILEQLETALSDYFNDEDLISKGLPTVQYISDKLNLSPNYLRSLLKVLTGQSTQQHIHEKLIQKAKEKLSTTELSISQIAYSLGFEHPQSFSKFFKTKTNSSPQEFRKSFN